jgi:hypothetical protein
VSARRAVLLLVIALAAYFALVGYRGVFLLGESSFVLKALGAAVLALPVVGLWLVGAEIRFGFATQRLAHRLDAEGEPPEPEPPRRRSGRVDRHAADALFERRRHDVEDAPADWRRWYRLAVAYDVAGDRHRARAAMRTAIARESP